MIKAKDGKFFIEIGLETGTLLNFFLFGKKFTLLILNCVEFDVIKSQAGLNSFNVSVKEWAEKTNAIGLIANGKMIGATLDANPNISKKIELFKVITNKLTDSGNLIFFGV